MTEKLRAIEERYEALARQLEDPAVYGDPEKLKKLNREQKELAPVVEAFRAYRRAESDLRDAQELLSDPEMKGKLKKVENLEMSTVVRGIWQEN